MPNWQCVKHKKDLGEAGAKPTCPTCGNATFVNEKKAAAPVTTFELVCPNGATAPHESFAARAKETEYANWIEAVRSAGATRAGGKELIHGCNVCHDTQKRNNVTVFFDWQGTVLKIYGLGQHKGGDGAGNDKYEMLWFDGKNKTWSRPKKKR